MTRTTTLPLAALAALVLAAAGCGSSSGAAGTQALKTSSSLIGAGSTLVQPLVVRWTADYGARRHVTIDYGAIGSGGGMTAIRSKTVDFGASDAPLQGAQKEPGLVQIPWALAATAIAVNLPGIAEHPKLTGPVLADIFSGKVRYWNDPEIASLNRGLTLPHLAVAPVHRSDPSGDTFVFTTFLSRTDPSWKTKVGAGTDVSWPIGAGARGNAGVAGVLTQTRGAIAYVAIAQVKGAHLNYALVRNRAGQYLDPSPATIAAAASTARFASDDSSTIVDAPKGYPLSTFTYALVRRSSSKIGELKRFLRYAVGRGQSFAAPLDFAPLPASVRSHDLTVIAGL